MSDKHSAIGVFDSGLGGLSAVKELKKLLPHEHIVYFGDTGRVPYGTRSASTIVSYALDDMRFLMSFDIKAALIACGTVSSVALDELKNRFPLPIIGVVEPACRAAKAASAKKRIAVFATPATVRNGAYERTLRALDPAIRVYPVACTMFVPLIENGYIDRKCEVTRLIAAEYLSALNGTDADTIVLGCTHYPIIRSLIEDVAEEVLGYTPKIIDSGYESAVAAKELLKMNTLENTPDTAGDVRYFVSDEPHNFEAAASVFLGEKPDNITRIAIGGV